MTRSALIVLITCLSLACATARPTFVTDSMHQTPASWDRPSSEEETARERAEARRITAQWALMRANYHDAFDQRSVLMIDLVEDSAYLGIWDVTYNFIQPDQSGLPQIGGHECRITTISRPTCAIVMPASYEEFTLSMTSTDPLLRRRFEGRLRVRRGSGEVVEYRTLRYEEATDTSILAPSSVIDARPASGSTTAAR